MNTNITQGSGALICAMQDKYYDAGSTFSSMRCAPSDHQRHCSKCLHGIHRKESLVSVSVQITQLSPSGML